jgi:hypothetical protein
VPIKKQGLNAAARIRDFRAAAHVLIKKRE